jgi:putative ATPase
VNAPLLSRARVFTFRRLSDDDIGAVIDHAVTDIERGLGALNVDILPDARHHLVDKSEGDARTALNALEAAALIARPESRKKDARRVITAPLAEQALQRRVLLYDKTGDNHYDIISAFIKSVRGTDPDAALYYLARMLTAGEDARFIARRLVILASEDIGNADPMALTVANAAAHAVEFVGLPEAQINLAHAVTYLAAAPKSNASYIGLKRALADVEAQQSRPIPKYLRDPRTGTARDKTEIETAEYLYPHDYSGSYVRQQYIPEGVQTQKYYEPTENGRELAIKNRLNALNAIEPKPREEGQE